MTTNDVSPGPHDTQTIDEAAARCSACAHPQAIHDAIAARFCNATVAGRYQRGCVCTVRPTPKSAGKTG